MGVLAQVELKRLGLMKMVLSKVNPVVVSEQFTSNSVLLISNLFLSNSYFLNSRNEFPLRHKKFSFHLVENHNRFGQY